MQRQYVEFLSDWRTDLGGRKNFHNGAGGTYDCIAILSYYAACKAVTSFREIEADGGKSDSARLPQVKVRGLQQAVFQKAHVSRRLRGRSRSATIGTITRWRSAPFDKNKPIYYEFTACPAAEFAIKHGLTDIMPALCNVDYASMELIHARLVRTTTCANGCKCDYTICGDKDPYLRDHPEYRDEAGYRRNR